MLPDAGVRGVIGLSLDGRLVSVVVLAAGSMVAEVANAAVDLDPYSIVSNFPNLEIRPCSKSKIVSN